MEVFCIINGCKNNGKNKENDSGNVLFHMFPSNPVLKARWLKAIGRSDWEPPDYAGICNNHFNTFQLKSNFAGSLVEVCRICLAADDDMTLYSLQYGKLKQYMDTILPINNDSCLPQFVCFECAAHLRKCYNMIKKSETSQAILSNILEQNGEITKSAVKKLNREKLELKSPLVSHSGTPTYLLVYKFNYETNVSDRIDLKLIYDLKEEKVEMDTKSESDSVHTYDSDDDDENLGQDPNCTMKFVSNPGSCNDDKTGVENDINITIFYTDDEKYSDRLSEESSDKISFNADENNENNKKDENCVKSRSDHVYVSCNDNATDIENDENISVINIDDERNRAGLSEKSSDRIQDSSVDENNKNILRKRKKRGQQSDVRSKRKKATKNEESIAKHFNIVNLMTLQDKIDEFNEAMKNPHWMRTTTKETDVYKCEVCTKLFANLKTYEQHRVSHDPSYGTAECPVCKMRYRDRRALKSHMLKHMRKYNCKLCPKSCYTTTAAIKHYREHIRQVYKCKRCSFTSCNQSMLSTHVLKAHSHAYACELCGRPCVNRRGLKRHLELQHRGEQLASESGEMFPCEECNLKFNSENALRVHLLTSVQHREYANSTLQNACKLCGASFITNYELWIHKKEVHLGNKVRYPHQRNSTRRVKCLECECCDTKLNSGFEFYWHMRRKHPEYEYQRNAAAICPTCGKSFKCETVLRYHELRHSSPRERCDLCGRMFYDKMALASHHTRVHKNEQPYICKECGRAFNTKSNMNRHMLIHTGEMPYQCSICDRKFTQSGSLKLHVRTVHLKMPHPPRKKRKANTQKTEALDNDTNT